MQKKAQEFSCTKESKSGGLSRESHGFRIMGSVAELSMSWLDQAPTRPENASPNPKLIYNCKSAGKNPNNCLQIFVQFNAKFCSILLLFTLLYGLQACNTKLVYAE